MSAHLVQQANKNQTFKKIVNRNKIYQKTAQLLMQMQAEHQMSQVMINLVIQKHKNKVKRGNNPRKKYKKKSHLKEQLIYLEMS